VDSACGLLAHLDSARSLIHALHSLDCKGSNQLLCLQYVSDGQGRRRRATRHCMNMMKSMVMTMNHQRADGRTRFRWKAAQLAEDCGAGYGAGNPWGWSRVLSYGPLQLVSPISSLRWQVEIAAARGGKQDKGGDMRRYTVTRIARETQADRQMYR
jgi:hypothetical protein